MKLRTAYVLAFSLIAAWGLTALILHQPLWATQRGRDLLKLGAANGDIFTTQQWWRLLTSQWLHMKFAHMLLNAALIGWVGLYVERSVSARFMLLAYAIGGCLAQAVGVWLYPDLITSGASQALLSLSAIALCLPNAARKAMPSGLIAACIAILIAAALDIVSAHTLKAGHLAGLGIGLIIGIAYRFEAARHR